MDRRCAIISGGAFSPLRGIEAADYIIACDKGCEYALRCGVTPDLLVGDFDSYRGALPEGVPRLSLPVEKDDTDTMAAVRYAVEQGFAHVTLYCALGGRLDHLLGNLQAAAYAAEHGAQAEIEDAQTTLYLFGNGTKTIPARPGYSLSVLSLTDVCRGVSIDGTKYRLKDAVLTNTFPIGISNEWEGDARISVVSGILMVVLSKLGEAERLQHCGAEGVSDAEDSVGAEDAGGEAGPCGAESPKAGRGFCAERGLRAEGSSGTGPKSCTAESAEGGCNG